MTVKKVYLVAKYAMRPQNKSQTFKPGYMKDPDNIHWDESVDVTVGIKNRDLVSAQVILNISEQKIVKNSYNNDKTFMELFGYFYTSSPQEIGRALKATGISITEQKEESTGETIINTVTDENTANVNIQKDVHSKAEASERPESSPTAELAVSGKRTQRRKGRNLADAESNPPPTAGNREPKEKTESSLVQN